MRQLTMLVLCVVATTGAEGCIALDEDGDEDSSEARDSGDADDSGGADDTGDSGGAEVSFSDVLNGATLLPDWDGTCGAEASWDCCDNLTLTLATTAEEARAALDDELDGACCVDGVDFSANSVLIAYTEGCPAGPEVLSVERILGSATGDLEVDVLVTVPTDMTDAAWRPYAVVAIPADGYAGVTGSAEIVWEEPE